MIGYYDNWDKSIPEDNYTVGIIDMDFTVRSDDRSLEIKHADLLNCIIRRLSSKCKIKQTIIEPTTDSLVEAVSEMIASGIKVINISLGTQEKFQFPEKVLKAIYDNNIIIVCAGGNNNEGLMYPANSDGTIGILACDIYGRYNKSFDNTEKLIFTMPGLHLYLFDSFFSGTSLSAVYFSVLCAGYTANNPSLTINEVIEDIKSSCINKTEISNGIVRIDKLFLHREITR